MGPSRFRCVMVSLKEPEGFEPTRENRMALAGPPVNHSGKAPCFERSLLGIEPRTSSTQRKNHATRPEEQVENKVIETLTLNMQN
jgi:hypothetical protein